MPLANRCGGGGGTPQLCGQIDNFKVFPGTPAPAAKLTWTAPEPDEDGSFVGVKIVRKVGSAPTSMTDGTKVYEGTALTYTDTGLTAGTTYYYRAFAYNAKGKYQTAYRVVSLTALNISVEPVLNDNTWAQIKAASDAGIAASIWNVGDTKSITISSFKIYNGSSYVTQDITVDAFILGFNHNAAIEGTNRIHFHIGKQDGKQIALRNDPSGINSHEISATALMEKLSSDLKAVLKSTLKYSKQNSSSQPVTSETTQLTLLGPVEAFGEESGWYTYLGSYEQQYDYYAAGNSLMHYLNNDQYINWSTGPKYTGSVRLRGKGSQTYHYEIDDNGLQDWTDGSYSDTSAFIFFV